MKHNCRTGKLILFLFLCSCSIQAQDTLRYSREQAEAVFLKENLLLIAEKLNISQSEALVSQSKLWPNPVFTVDQVNFWATDAQTGGHEVIPPLGSIGPNQQFGIGIEQLIRTAGKRKKLVALEQVAVEKSEQYFEDLLRNLKVEFRNQLTHLQYLQFSKSTYQNQLHSIRQLTQAYQRQVNHGNVPQGEYIRLKALELEMAKNYNELNKEVNESQMELKLLMRLPATTYLIITDEGYLKETGQAEQLVLNEVIELAKIHRPDFKMAELEESYFSKLYTYERAQRVPDLTLSSAYDRGGNAMFDFIGFGIQLELPFFNRNQGNIKYAQIGREQSRVLYEQMTLSVENEIVLSYQNLLNAIAFMEEIEPGFGDTLDTLLEGYTKNFTERNMSLLEYLDFMDAYLENKRIILEAGKEVNERAEELNYSVGVDLIK